MQKRLTGAVIRSANGDGSIENREAVARSPIKFSIQVGICREHRLKNMTVEAIDLAVSASGGRGRVGRAGQQADFADVVAGPNKARRPLPGRLSVLADFKNSGDDDEQRRVSSGLR